MSIEFPIMNPPSVNNLDQNVVIATPITPPISTAILTPDSDISKLLSRLLYPDLEAMTELQLNKLVSRVINYPCSQRKLLIQFLWTYGNFLELSAEMPRQDQEVKRQELNAPSPERSLKSSPRPSNDAAILREQHNPESPSSFHSAVLPRTEQIEYDTHPPSAKTATTELEPAALFRLIFNVHHLQNPFIQSLAAAHLRDFLNNLAFPFNTVNVITSPIVLTFAAWLIISVILSACRCMGGRRAAWASICRRVRDARRRWLDSLNSCVSPDFEGLEYCWARVVMLCGLTIEMLKWWADVLLL